MAIRRKSLKINEMTSVYVRTVSVCNEKAGVETFMATVFIGMMTV